jgi:hypothetical protein
LLKFLHGVDAYDRHRGVAYLLKKHCAAPATILDVGGEVALSANHIGQFITGYKITTANTRSTTDIVYGGFELPFEDNSFDAVITIDTLEHVPPKNREFWLRELFRVARKTVVIAGPFASEYNDEADRYLCDLHMKLHHKPHQLHEHVENGCPTIDSINAIGAIAGQFTLSPDGVLFEGDTRAWKKDYETMFRLDKTPRLLKPFLKVLFAAWTMRRVKSMNLLSEPGLYSHRFYAAFTR